MTLIAVPNLLISITRIAKVVSHKALSSPHLGIRYLGVISVANRARRLQLMSHVNESGDHVDLPFRPISFQELQPSTFHDLHEQMTFMFKPFNK